MVKYRAALRDGSTPSDQIFSATMEGALDWADRILSSLPKAARATARVEIFEVSEELVSSIKLKAEQ